VSAEAREQNALTLRRLFDALNRGGTAAVVEYIEDFVDPGFEWRGGPAGRDMVGGDTIYRGYQGARDFYAEIDRYIESFRFSEVAVEALDDEVLLAQARLWMRTRGSQVEFEQAMGYVYRFRGGRILLGEAFRSRAEAEATARRLVEERVDA
jgi:ketosteroid isomerase-like protein